MAARIATVAGSRDLEDERIRQMEARQQQQQQNTVAIFSRFSLNRTLRWRIFCEYAATSTIITPKLYIINTL